MRKLLVLLVVLFVAGCSNCGSCHREREKPCASCSRQP